jgi:hypothetical protein
MPPLFDEIPRTQTVHAVDGGRTFPLKDAIDAEIGAPHQRLILVTLQESG